MKHNFGCLNQRVSEQTWHDCRNCRGVEMSMITWVISQLSGVDPGVSAAFPVTSSGRTNRACTRNMWVTETGYIYIYIYIYALIYPWILDSLVISNDDMSNRIKKLKRNILQHVLFPPNPVVAPHLQSSRSSSSSSSSPSPSPSPSPSSSPPSPSPSSSSSSHHHITLKFATPPNNMLVGVTTSTLSSWEITLRHPLWTICWLG